jgi:hypothetical protein
MESVEYLIEPLQGLMNTVILDTECVRDIMWLKEPDDAMNHLVFPRRDLEMINALSRKHDRGKVSIWGADFELGMRTVPITVSCAALSNSSHLQVRLIRIR